MVLDRRVRNCGVFKTPRNGRLLGKWQQRVLREGSRLGRVESRLVTAALALPDAGRPARHRHVPNDLVALDRQADGKILLERDLAGFTPAADVARAGKDVILDLLELELRRFDLEVFRPRLHLLDEHPPGRDAAKRSARRDGLDVGMEVAAASKSRAETASKNRRASASFTRAPYPTGSENPRWAGRHRTPAASSTC